METSIEENASNDETYLMDNKKMRFWYFSLVMGYSNRESINGANFSEFSLTKKAMGDFKNIAKERGLYEKIFN